MAGVWSGYLTFGLVTLPVRLFSGARSESVHFHLLHAPDHARLKQQMICTQDGAIVQRDQTARGYEYAKGEYVVIPETDIKAAAPHTQRQLEIVSFCRAEELDPVWFDASYYLMPEPAGRRAYALLLQALRESERVAIAQLSMHNREYLSLVRPSELAGVPDGHAGGRAHARAGLMLHTLFYLDEVRVADGFGSTGDAEVAPAELKLAEQLIEARTAPFDATRFEDHYRKNLEAVIASALEGKPAPKPAAARRLAPVTDLMASLKASLSQTPAAKETQPQPAARKPPASAKTARKTPRRHKAA